MELEVKKIRFSNLSHDAIRDLRGKTPQIHKITKNAFAVLLVFCMEVSEQESPAKKSGETIEI